MITRRDMLKRTVASGIVLVAAPMTNRGRFQLFAGSTTEYSRRAIDLVGRSTVIDMLSVLTLDFPKNDKWMADPESFTAADFQPFKDSGINIIHPAVGLGGTNAFDGAMRWFAAWNAFIANNDAYMIRIDSPADIDRVKKSGKLGILLGLQNSQHFRNPGDVDVFRGLGQRV